MNKNNYIPCKVIIRGCTKYHPLQRCGHPMPCIWHGDLGNELEELNKKKLGENENNNE